MFKKKLYNTGLVFSEHFVRTFNNVWGYKHPASFVVLNTLFGINAKAAGISFSQQAQFFDVLKAT